MSQKNMTKNLTKASFAKAPYKSDTKLDAPQQQIVPPKSPAAKVKVVQVLVKHRTRDKEDFGAPERDYR